MFWNLGLSKPTLFECFACHHTWEAYGTAGQTCPRCLNCGSYQAMKYDNERTAALEAAGVE